MPAKLSVNLNAVAMLRNRRDLPWPSVTALGRIALEAGASGLTVHPRPDQRHVRFSDLQPIRDLIDDEFSETEFNMEGYPNEEFLRLVETHEPEQVTLVPDDPAQATSDHGWDFRKNHNLLGSVVGRLKKKGFRVSLFADGDEDAEALRIARKPVPTASSFTPAPMAAAMTIRKRRRRLLPNSDAPPRSPPASASK